MSRLSYNEEIELITKNTIEALNYYKDTVRYSFDVEDNFKGLSYMVFDKNFKPYLIMPERDQYTESGKKDSFLNYEVYVLENENGFKQLRNIGSINTERFGKLVQKPIANVVKTKLNAAMKTAYDLEAIDREEMRKAVYVQEKAKRLAQREMRIDELALLEIHNSEYMAKGLGKEMFKFFEYSAFVMGATKMKGKAYPMRPELVGRKELFKFYEDRGVELSKVSGNMKKKFNNSDMLRYAKRIATFKEGNVVIKVVFPEHAKELVMDNILKKPSKNKTSIIKDMREF